MLLDVCMSPYRREVPKGLPDWFHWLLLGFTVIRTRYLFFLRVSRKKSPAGSMQTCGWRVFFALGREIRKELEVLCVGSPCEQVYQLSALQIAFPERLVIVLGFSKSSFSPCLEALTSEETLYWFSALLLWFLFLVFKWCRSYLLIWRYFWIQGTSISVVVL